MKNIKIKTTILLLAFFSSFFMTVNSIPAYAEEFKEYVLHQGQSMFISKDHLQKENILKSDNEKVVAVSNGILTAKSVGEAFCSTTDSEGSVKYKIKVVKPQELKYMFTEPNNPQKGSPISLVAITDKSIKNVVFLVETPKGIIKVKAKDHKVDGETFIHKGYIEINEAGEYKVTVRVIKRIMSYNVDGNVFFIRVNDENSMESTERRPSDNCILYVKAKEGFKSKLSSDAIVNGVYDIGYGNVIYPEVPFYNNITEAEASAMLINRLNNDVYCKSLNSFLIKNEIANSQNQFDALLSFTYNLGTSWIKNSDLQKIILSKKNTESIKKAYVNSKTGLKIRSTPSINGSVLKILNFNEKVEVIDKENGWYKVKLSDDKEGFCYSEYLTLEKDIKESCYTESIKKAYVNSKTGLKIRSTPSINGSVLKILNFNEEVEVIDKENDWYRVKISDDKEGFCFGEYLTVEDNLKNSLKNINDIEKKISVNRSFSLNDIDKKEFSDELLLYHKAAGRCIKGLLNRRIEELQIFFYKDYSLDGYKNKHGFELPSCH